MEVREGAAGVGSVKRAGATARVRRVAAIARVFAIEDLAARVKHHVSYAEKIRAGEARAIVDEAEKIQAVLGSWSRGVTPSTTRRTPMLESSIGLFGEGGGGDSIPLIQLSMEYCRRMMEVQAMWGGAGGHGGNDPDPIAVSPEAAAGFPDLRKKLRVRVARNFTLAIAPHFPQALLPSDIGIDFMVCTTLLHPKRQRI